MSPKNKAFTLIEISIVILIIGILIAGVVTAQKLVTKSRLASARALTQSSPVASIKDLALWLETTSSKSFNNFDSLEDASAIATWRDINPNTVTPSDATQSNSTYQPLFYNEAINGLPALKFDGTDDEIDSGAPFFKSGFPYINNNFAVFVVAYPSASIVMRSESVSDQGGNAGQKYLLGARHGDVAYSSTLNTAGMGISLGTNGVMFIEHSSYYMPALMAKSLNTGKPVLIEAEYRNKTPTFYLDGEFNRTGLTSEKTYVFPPYQIGGGLWGNFRGYIGEVIIFSRDLSDEESKAVNNYLKQKWNIR